MSISKVKEPKNAITSISEIPAIVKGTDLLVIRLTREVNGVNREVIMLGETHVATSEEAKAVSRIMPYFKNVGCEGVDVSEILEGRIFFWFMEKTAILASIFSLGRRSGKHKSSLELAQDYAEDVQAKKRVIFLEKGWCPSLRLRAFFVVFPLYMLWSICIVGSSGVDIGNKYGWLWTIAFIGGVVFFNYMLIYVPIIKHAMSFIIRLMLNYIFDVTPSRNRNMSKNLVTILEKNVLIDSILVVVGKVHIKPMVKILKNKYGFTEKAFT